MEKTPIREIRGLVERYADAIYGGMPKPMKSMVS